MIEYLSYSNINLYLTCSEAWRRKYIEKQPSTTTPALVFGSAFHNTVEGYIRAAAERAPAKLPDLWHREWAAAMEREPNCEWGSDDPDTHRDEGLRLLENPELAVMLNRLTPLRDEAGLFIERKIELRVPGVPVPVIGYIDLVTSDGVPGDFKTSAFAWTAEKAKAELQPLFYLAAMNQLGRSVPGLRFRHYVITKAKTSKVQLLETQHTWDGIFWLYELVQRVWKAIEAETFVPNPGAWLCSPKYCSHWSDCRGRGL